MPTNISIYELQQLVEHTAMTDNKKWRIQTISELVAIKLARNYLVFHIVLWLIIEPYYRVVSFLDPPLRSNDYEKIRTTDIHQYITLCT